MPEQQAGQMCNFSPKN